ncbi:hypothetical protein ABZ402_50420 [Streptomyces mirabilis]|uniref:hypothetical protein n=1 Tax=Streptomyces mirabilis TaxID=68239 RepID=UPI0033C0DC20
MTRKFGKALASGAFIVAAVASTAFSCTSGTTSGSDQDGTGRQSTAPQPGRSEDAGTSSGGGTRQTTKPKPHHTTPTTPRSPEWTPSGPASVTTCGTVANGYQCAVHGEGFKPGEIVDWTNVDTNSRNSELADSHGSVDFKHVVLDAPGVTITVRLHGEESGQEATGTWTLT